MSGESGNAVSHAYDSIGNRVTSSEAGGGNALYDRNRLNQYLTVAWPTGTGSAYETLTYDADVDLMDFSVMEGCFKGANRPAACQ